MACQIDALQIDPRYKEGLQWFCSDPENAQVCQQICEMPPEILNEHLATIENELVKWTEEGVPPELREEVAKRDPQTARDMDEFMAVDAPQIMQQEQQIRGGTAPMPSAMEQPVQGFANGGLAIAAAKGRFGDDSLAHVDRGEVIVPNAVFKDNPGLRQGLGELMMESGADPRYYTVGNPRNRINPRTGLPEYGFLGKALGAVAGFMIGGPAGAAAGAGLGAAAGGMLIDGDSFGEAAMWGLGVYGGASLAAGSGMFGAAHQAGAATWAGGGGLSAAGITAAQSAAATAGVEGGIAGLSQGAIADSALAGAGSAGFEGTLGTSMGVPSIAVTPQTAATTVAGTGPVAQPGALLAEQGAAASPSLIDKGIAWVKENPATSAIGALGLAGAMEPIPVAPPPSGAEYFNEYDAYTDCLAAGGSEAECQAAHPKGWAEIAPPPKSQWLAGTGQIEGQPGQPLTPTGVPTYQNEAWYQQMGQFGYAGGGYVNGPGSEKSDSIPARLSNNEFVLTADAVRGAGDGSVRKGAQRLYALMDRLERRA